MNTQIAEALEDMFEQHRIIFWYDEKREFGDDFEALELEGVQKRTIANNEFALKHLILRKQRDRKFLLYKSGPRPAEDLDNWLLDVELYSGEFRSDEVALLLSELSLSLEFTDLIREHMEFFRAKERKEKLKKILDKETETPRSLQLKMLSVITASDVRLDAILESLLAENAKNQEKAYKLIVRCALEEFLWESVERHYGYTAKHPTIEDFVLTLFKDAYFGHFGEARLLNNDALVFLSRWKDSHKHLEAFEILSKRCAKILGIEGDLNERDYKELIEIDCFELIDRKIISDLVRVVRNRQAAEGAILQWCRARRQSHWYERYRDIYAAIEYAAKFVADLQKCLFEIESPTHGVTIYTTQLAPIDRLYRKYIYHMQASRQSTLLGDLSIHIENLYINNYLLKLGNSWQTHIDRMQQWHFPSLTLQKDFFKKYITPVLQKRGKIYVIISDAMRYEIGEELAEAVRQEDMFEANVDTAISMLPSYTQLGMAALLPHKSLRINDDAQATVSVDGINARSANRGKILQSHVPKSGAIQAKTLMQMKRDGDEGTRALVREHELVYIYHDVIDYAGKLKTQDSVSEAAQRSIDEIKQIIRKLTSANATHILVTADHGFLYQHRELDESDYLAIAPSGKEITYEDRRFVLGRGLEEEAGFKKFTSAQIGLEGDLEVLIPKSINRLKRSGSSSRFVHGGASLQEIVIPIVQIHKKRSTDSYLVEVEIIRGSSSTITSGQLAVTFYQREAVSDKIRPRTLRAGIYTLEGVLISDTHTLTFDLTSENPREREIKVRFLLSQNAKEANGQEVVLKLEEPVEKTSHYQEYASVRYHIRRSFNSDFDL